MEINILIHGNSDGFNSDFMQYINNELKAIGKECYGFDFDYITNGTEPSVGYEDELSKLRGIIEGFERKGYDKINLIGKSLGGTICLNREISNDPAVQKIVIIGFPFILGFPVDLALLKVKPVVAKPGAEDMYIKVFNTLDANKIKIIQGRDDLLGSNVVLSKLFRRLNTKPEIFYIKNASHGFKPINDTSTFEDNMEKITELLKVIL
ncbi:MAG TPA: alpha/beta family hydrolase [Candidatus Dojkabacteria bacterium]|nr:alpha/beta family hydrolase [Candidatus Dojkabacteria bacterium]